MGGDDDGSGWVRGRSRLVTVALIVVALAATTTVSLATTTIDDTPVPPGSTTDAEAPAGDAPPSDEPGDDGAAPPEATQAGLLTPGSDLPDVFIAIPWVMPVVTGLAASPRAVGSPPGRVRALWVQSSDGLVTLRLDRVLPGRRLGARCVAFVPALRAARSCTRSVRVRLRTVVGREGLNRFAFAGPGLPSGRYLLTARPRDPGGNLGSPRRAVAIVR